MYNALWQSVLGEIELSVSEMQFSTWFKPTELVENTGDSVTIAVSNPFAKTQFERKFDTKIKEILEKNGVHPSTITYIVKSNGKRTITRETTVAMPSVLDDRVSKLTAPVSTSGSGLNPRYTFDNFIVGSNNDLAHAACQAVAANPGTKYNPLYLYGGVGLGKTHLMQAVGNEIIKNNPDARVLYINTETFVKEFTDSIRFKKKGVSDKYRGVDVLIVDDMQFIAGKEKTQEEFFHTFNTLHQNDKQVIISSDKPPRSIPTLTERLRSRFEMGMAIDVQMPDFETRCAILEAKASLSGVELERETTE
ncbi:MAG TPA: chromosomal replication initiator protein DnaA, partial [Candidatus Saccharimonadaceae bacterium]|nr:chromosomal replication initiator protein DnaA [Candidatus Saccharimonadaceae bacterium]